MSGDEVINEKKVITDAKKKKSGAKKETVKEERADLKAAEEREKERKVEEQELKQEEKEERVKEKKDAKTKIQIRKKPRHGKKYRELAKLIDIKKEYPISEAIELAIKTNPAKFDATIETHIKINNKEKNIRGMVKLPGGLAKERKILEVTEKNVDDVVASLKTGKIEFDVMIADLKIMPKLAILAKMLGPKGLMPSPKAGTAVEDVAKAVEELKAGKTEYRADKDNIVHLAIGKISFGAEKIYQNFEAIVNTLPKKKIDTLYLTTTMGPSIKIAIK